MCGITAYIGKERALPFLIQGLEKLEYRGYDSSGITLIENNQIITKKSSGKLENLKDKLKQTNFRSNIGIGHTRWATHGLPSNLNAHPHNNASNTISLVHNGIIENYDSLKKELLNLGYKFQSDTDTEVVVHLLDLYHQNNMKDTLLKVLPLLEGSYSLCILHKDEPNTIYLAKKDTPMVVGINETGSFGASDIPAILDYTKDVYFLDDFEICTLQANKITFYDFKGNKLIKSPKQIPYDNESAKKDGYPTYMLKEINEQPKIIKDTLRTKIKNNKVLIPEINNLEQIIKKINKTYFIGCGTAYHAGIVGANIYQKLTNTLALSQVASEFRYNKPLIDKQSLCIFISQSGETADTLAALKKAKQKGATCIAICNVIGSSIAREADLTLYTSAGIEISVASTKAYTSQLLLLILLAINVGQIVNSKLDTKKLINDLTNLPDHIKSIINDIDIFEKYGQEISAVNDVYFIGRSLDYVSSQEGALKLKEISYIHADAYFAGELKHGPIALIEKDTNVIALATQEQISLKTISNIQETIARGAKVFLIKNQDTQSNNTYTTYQLPKTNSLLYPILSIIPLQLIAYFAAKYKGCDVDKPRNLAKSVTVE